MTDTKWPKDADGYYTSALICEHANEMPAECPCESDCYCKANSCAREGCVAKCKPLRFTERKIAEEPDDCAVGAGLPRMRGPAGLRANDTFTIRVGRPELVRLVVEGETLRATDLYKSTSGEWEPCPCPGVTYNGGATFVRPILEP